MKELRVCSVSGGKDSTALYCLMVEYYGKDFLPLFADTGNEHPVTVNYVRNMHVMAGGPEVQICRADFNSKLEKKGKEATGNPFLDMMIWKGRAPSTKAQFCTEWVKLWPQLMYLEKRYPLEQWTMFSGIRQGESLRRLLGYPMPYTTNSYFDCDYVLPLLYTTEQEVFGMLEAKGVPPNPLYALGYGRVGCFPCIHANKGELSLLPDWAWDKLEYWESVIGRTWFDPGLLPQSMSYIPTIPEVRQWCKTSRGGKQYDLYKTVETADAPSCMSTWGICE
jgi:3'-phosphoadenosine 5'-phosphosulfate sulfotransferase (PAPS reductase)/FAD synthetase